MSEVVASAGKNKLYLDNGRTVVRLADRNWVLYGSTKHVDGEHAYMGSFTSLKDALKFDDNHR